MKTSVLIRGIRGASDSPGHTSWTGKPEMDDYASIVGLLVYYLEHLDVQPEQSRHRGDILAPATSKSQPNGKPNPSSDESSDTPRHLTSLLLAGYSFGSLILARLPSVSTILEVFESAEQGTAASEILLQAQLLAKQTRQSLQAPRSHQSHFQLSPTDPPSRGPLVTVGGEEADRPRSHGCRSSAELIVRDIPRNIKIHRKRHSGQFESADRTTALRATRRGVAVAPAVSVHYLLISPVLLPMATTLLPPGLPLAIGSTRDAQAAGLLTFQHDTLIMFGSSDAFTASRRLCQWAEKFAQSSSGHVQWKQIEGAGHFWREEGVMHELKSRIAEWVKTSL